MAQIVRLQGRGGGSTGEVVIGTVSIDRVLIPGQILVTKMSDPAMLADMLKAGAVVTDEGGPLCHAAIVCIEFGIPYVVGTKRATELLHQGDEVSVNPATGEVVKS